MMSRHDKTYRSRAASSESNSIANLTMSADFALLNCGENRAVGADFGVALAIPNAVMVRHRVVIEHWGGSNVTTNYQATTA